MKWIAGCEHAGRVPTARKDHRVALGKGSGPGLRLRGQRRRKLKMACAPDDELRPVEGGQGSGGQPRASVLADADDGEPGSLRHARLLLRIQGKGTHAYSHSG